MLEIKEGCICDTRILCNSSKQNALLDNGKISALEAKLKAHNEYEQYRVKQDKEYLSDFDKILLDMKIDD